MVSVKGAYVFLRYFERNATVLYSSGATVKKLRQMELMIRNKKATGTNPSL
jgi:hypothetical protein